MKYWIKGGLIYGLVAFLVSIAAAALRTHVLVPATNADSALMIELPLMVLVTVGLGFAIMKWMGGPWTTRTTFDFGFIGGVVLVALEIQAAFMQGLDFASFSRETVAAYLTAPSLTHGMLFPFAVIALALAPSFLTQKA
jgi:hypothetical protein